MALQDHVGKKHGIWTLIGPLEGEPWLWLAQCECNGTRITTLQAVQMAAHARTGNCRCGRYGDTPEYAAFIGMHGRCRNPKDRSYRNYGGRGIKVSERWFGQQGFRNFVADIGLRPSPKHSIDRIDVDGNYEPGNVRWATVKVQANNRRNSKWREAVSL